MAGEDLLDNLIEKIAEAVVRKIEEQQKIELIAEAVLDRLAADVKKGRRGNTAARSRKGSSSTSTARKESASTSRATGGTSKAKTATGGRSGR